MNQRLEDFLADLATKPASAMGYHPGTAGDIPPDVLEREAQALENDPRVSTVERQFASETLIQLWVVLA
jgi:hypothetical protein